MNKNQTFNNWRPSSEKVLRKNSCINLKGQYNVPHNSCYKNMCVDHSARQLPKIHRQSMCRPDEFGAPDVCGVQELNRLREDVCYLNSRNYQSKKPLKFQTYQWRPYQWLTGAADPKTGLRKGGVITPSYPGFNAWDGAVGACTIADETDLKLSGIMNTNPRLVQELPELRPNQGRIHGWRNIDQESHIRDAAYQDNSKTCTPTEVQLFESNVKVPLKHLCFNPNDPEWVVQKNHGLRGGISTRSNLRSDYVSGKYCQRGVTPLKL